MKICVIGGAGFIGSHCCEALLALNHEVICLDNFQTSTRENIEPFFSHPNFSFIFHDITMPFDVPCDAQIHCAAIASPKFYMKDPLKTALTIGVGSVHVLENATRYHAMTLLLSTSEVYGEPLEHPQKETYSGNVTINSLRASYDESKRYMETLGFVYAHEKQIDVKVVRLFNTYGPRMQLNDGRIVTQMIHAYKHQVPLTIFGDGEQTRCFSYIDDTLEQLLHVFFHGPCNTPINCGSNIEITINELIQIFETVVLKPINKVFCPALSHDPRLRQPDLSRIDALMKRNITPLSVGLRKTLESFNHDSVD
jgi:UDP-glucuronate decarboxylase